MSFNIQEDANFVGGIDYSDLTKIGKFNNAEVITNGISANATEQFNFDESNDFVKSTNQLRDEAVLPQFARLIDVKFNVRGNSQDSELLIYQSEQYREVDQVVSITQNSVSDTPSTFILGSGIGVPFVNKEKESDIYFEIIEKSGNTSEYDIEFNWLNVRRS